MVELEQEKKEQVSHDIVFFSFVRSDMQIMRFQAQLFNFFFFLKNAIVSILQHPFKYQGSAILCLCAGKAA